MYLAIFKQTRWIYYGIILICIVVHVHEHSISIIFILGVHEPVWMNVYVTAAHGTGNLAVSATILILVIEVAAYSSC